MKSKVAPLTGAAFVVLLILSFVIGGEPPEAKDGVREVVQHYEDNYDAISISAILVLPAATLLVFFGVYLRNVLRAGRGDDDGWLATAVLIGTVVVAIGGAIDAMILFAINEAVDQGVDGQAVLSLQALWDNDWIPIALGTALFLWGVGLSVLRYRTLPRWLGWVTIAFAVLGFTPLGFISVMFAALLVLALSIWLTVGRTPEVARVPTVT